MRIAALNWSNRVAGGTEEYLRKFLPAAETAGHDLSFWYETSEPADRSAIPSPAGGEWSVEQLGRETALAALRAWQPDLLYAHGLHDPELEEAAFSIAPTVFFIHNYLGACISGTKMTTLPVTTPCDRQFGPACLAHYYPRRCGGLNPITMWRKYRLETKRLAILRRCAAVVTHSHRMHTECVRNGIPADRVFSFPYYIADEPPDAPPPRPLSARPTLLFVGRFETGKGGLVLLDALPRVRATLRRPLQVIFAGDGRDRSKWEARAKVLQSADIGLRIEFTGWTNADHLAELYKQTDLLVVPSVWPEPFGRVGPEAGVHGVPVAAFAVGGTPDWLTDSENGFLAPGSPPTAAGLADAITQCLIDPAIHQRLRTRAAELAGRFVWANHFSALSTVFDRVAQGCRSSAGVAS